MLTDIPDIRCCLYNFVYNYPHVWLYEYHLASVEGNFCGFNPSHAINNINITKTIPNDHPQPEVFHLGFTMVNLPPKPPTSQEVDVSLTLSCISS